MTLPPLFILFCLLLLSGALGLLLTVLFRYRSEKHTASGNLTVYKAQLQEIDQDQHNGLLNAREANAARLEIERRLLRADLESETKVKSAVQPWPLPKLVLALILILTLSSGFYGLIGEPGRTDNPLDQRTDTAGLVKRQERVQAAQKFQRWYETEPENRTALLAYGGSLIMMSNGRVTPAALMVLQQARAVWPEHPMVRHYLALAAYQTDQKAKALAIWEALAADSKPDAPWFKMVNDWISQTRRDLGLAPDGPQ